MRARWRVLTDHVWLFHITWQFGSLRPRALRVLFVATAAFAFAPPIAAQGIRPPDGNDTVAMRPTPSEANPSGKPVVSLTWNEPLVSADAGRAGISVKPQHVNEAKVVTIDPVIDHDRRATHALVGAGIGAAVGIVVGAVIGSHLDHPRPGTYSAVPITAVEGGAVGLLAGLVVGASIP